MCVSAGVITGLAGYGLGYRVVHTNATQALQRELTRAKRPRRSYAGRERELRSELVDSLTVRAALPR